MLVRQFLLLSLLLAGFLSADALCADGSKTPKTVEVFRSDMSKMCNGDGTSLADDEKNLTGIKVYGRRKGNDGLMHPQVCGGPTGKLNVFKIAHSDLAKAIADGFAECGANNSQCK